jgi:hypothetical protein
VFLKFRAIQLAAQYQKQQTAEMQAKFFNIYVSYLNPAAPLPIRLYASMGIGRYIDMPSDEQGTQFKHNVVQPHVSNILFGVCSLLKDSHDDNVHIPLETLAALINFKPESISQIGKDVISLLLELCAKFASDPTVPMDIVNVFEKMATNRPNFETLRDVVVPQIAHILSSPAVSTQQQLVEVLIEVLTSILVKALPEDIPMLFANCFLPIVRLVLDNDDASLLQYGSDCLRAYIYVSGEQLLTYQFTITENNEVRQKAPVQFIFQVTAKLLQPGLEDQAVGNVGGIITALFTTVGHQLQSQVTEVIIKAAINRLAQAESLSLIQSLILVFAKLVHDHMDAVIGLLANYDLKNKNGDKLNALHLLLQKWVEYQNVFFGNYRLKVTALALVKLMLSGDQQLSINVQIDNPDDSNVRKTRSSGPLKKLTVPFAIQAFSLVIEAYFRAKEARELEEKGDLDAYLYGSDYSDDGEFEDDGDMPEFNEIDDEDENDHLAHLVSTYHRDDDDEDDIDDKFEKRDPLCAINLETVIPNSIREIIHKYNQLLPASERFLNDKQKKFITELIK